MQIQHICLIVAFLSVLGCRSLPSTDIKSEDTAKNGNSNDGAVAQSGNIKSIEPVDRSSFVVPFDLDSLGPESVSSGMNTPSDVSSIKPVSHTLELSSVINGFVLVKETKSREVNYDGTKHSVVEEFRYEYDYQANTIETKYSLFRFESGPSGPDLINYNENGWKTTQQSGDDKSLHVKTLITVNDGGEAISEIKSLELSGKPSLPTSISRIFNDDGTLQSEYLENKAADGSVNYAGPTKYVYVAGRLSSTHRKLSYRDVETKVYFYDDEGRVSLIAIDQDANNVAEKGFVLLYDKNSNIRTVLEVNALGELVLKVTYRYERSPEAVYNIPFRRLKYYGRF